MRALSEMRVLFNGLIWGNTVIETISNILNSSNWTWTHNFLSYFRFDWGLVGPSYGGAEYISWGRIHMVAPLCTMTWNIIIDLTTDKWHIVHLAPYCRLSARKNPVILFTCIVTCSQKKFVYVSRCKMGCQVSKGGIRNKYLTKNYQTQRKLSYFVNISPKLTFSIFLCISLSNFIILLWCKNMIR